MSCQPRSSRCKGLDLRLSLAAHFGEGASFSGGQRISSPPGDFVALGLLSLIRSVAQKETWFWGQSSETTTYTDRDLAGLVCLLLVYCDRSNHHHVQQHQQDPQTLSSKPLFPLLCFSHSLCLSLAPLVLPFTRCPGSKTTSR